VNPVTNKIYVTNQGSTNITILDGASNTTSAIGVGSHPVAVAVNPATNLIYVVNNNSDNVDVIDGGTGTLVGVATGKGPQAIAVNTVTNMIYVANGTDNNVTVIDGGNNSTSNVATGVNPIAVAVDTVTNRIYVANQGDNTITIIDGATKFAVTVPADSAPNGVAVDSATGKVFVPNALSNDVTVLTSASTSQVPLTTAIAPLTNNQTTSRAPGFTFTPTSTFSPTMPAVEAVYYQIDTQQGSWGKAAAPGFTGAAAGLSLGQHTLYAFAGDGQDAGINGDGINGQIVTSAMAAYTFNVVQAASTTALVADVNPVVVGGAVKFTATVTSAGSTIVPTGTVTFLDGTTSIGSSALNGSAVATLTISTLTAGTHSITATYSGDTNFTGSTSTAVSEAVGNPDFSLSANPLSKTVTAGTPATFTITGNSILGFAGAVALSCTGTPNLTTCSFSPPLVISGAGPANTSLTISTTSNAKLVLPGIRGHSEIFYATVFGIPALLFGMIVVAPAKRRKTVASCCLLFLALGGSIFLSACGGGSSTKNKGTTPGTYTITITGTSGTTTHTTSVSLTVQ
jgi:YVTN family beta-propeller protein